MQTIYIATVGIQNTEDDKTAFNIYPNPSKNEITLKAEVKLIGSLYVIYDLNGKSVLTGKIKSVNTVIEIENLTRGIYLFSAGENLKQTFRVVKE